MKTHDNAMLFWAGCGDIRARVRPSTMESALYRANPIEGCDTIFASCMLDNGSGSGLRPRMRAAVASPSWRKKWFLKTPRFPWRADAML